MIITSFEAEVCPFGSVAPWLAPDDIPNSVDIRLNDDVS